MATTRRDGSGHSGVPKGLSGGQKLQAASNGAPGPGELFRPGEAIEFGREGMRYEVVMRDGSKLLASRTRSRELRGLAI